MLRALHAVIAIRVDKPKDHINGIAIPVFAREELETGTVVASGPGEYDEKGKFTPNPVEEGDRVLLAKGSGRKVPLDGEELLFVTPSEVTAIIK